MRLGLAAWGLRETQLTEQLKMVSAQGVELLELGIGSFHTDFLQPGASPEQIAHVRRMFAEADVPFCCAATGNDFDGAGADESLKTTLEAIRITAELQITHLRIFAGFLPLEKLSAADREKELECLKIAAEAAAAKGIVPAMETHGAVEGFKDGVRHIMSSSTNPELVAETLDMIPELQLNFDPANLLAVGVDPLSFFRRFQSRIRYVHLKDFEELPSGALCGGACGAGKLPWHGLMAELRDFDGPVLIEYEQPGDVYEGFQKSVEFLKQCS